MTVRLKNSKERIPLRLARLEAENAKLKKDLAAVRKRLESYEQWIAPDYLEIPGGVWEQVSMGYLDTPMPRGMERPSRSKSRPMKKKP